MCVYVCLCFAKYLGAQLTLDDFVWMRCFSDEVSW